MLSIHFILNGVNCVANLQISVWLLTVAFCAVCLQVKMLAKDIYSQHFRAAQAVPRGVVAKLCAVVKQLEAACEKHCSQVAQQHIFVYLQ